MELSNKTLIIAVDFDGTIVEHKYPDIGPIIPGAFEVIRELQEKGHKLILWTVRDGIDLKNAVDFCLENGIMFYAVNESYPNEEFNKYMSRKINADIFIDDRNIGGFIGWDNIRYILLPETVINFTPSTTTNQKGNRSFFQKLFGK